MTKKLSMLYIPETLRHYTECHDFCLGELERIHNISLPILTMTKKLSMLYIPEILRHFTECHDFSLGKLERIHNISLY